MNVMHKGLVFALALTSVGYAGAVEVVPSGQFQVQVNYLEPAQVDNNHWTLDSLNSHVGVTAVETLSNSVFIGHWQAGIDPLAEDDTVEFSQGEAYLRWQQGYLGLWAGRLPSVEQAFLIDLSNNHLSLPQKGLAIGGLVNETENNAVRIDMSSGEYLSFTGQWVIDENQDHAGWSAATSVKTPEGVLSVTFRKPPEGAAIWGNQLTWDLGSTALSAAWLYQDEVLGWDLTASADLQTYKTFLNYSVLGSEDGRWSAGVHQILSEAITNYSEIIWWPNGEGWQWSTGFQFKF